MAPKDLFFIVLSILTAVTKWDLMGEALKRRTHMLHSLLYCPHLESAPLSRFCQQLLFNFVIDKVYQKEGSIQNFPCGIYVTDVIFQQTNYNQDTPQRKRIL